MANFKTHLAVASTASLVLSIGFLEAGVATPKDVVLYFAVGTLGGLLPDIDSDHSVPARLLFGFLAIVISFLTIFSRIERYSIVELSLLWGVTYVLVRYVTYKLFSTFTVHRGIFHSLLAACFFWFLTTMLAHTFFGMNKLLAWMTGFFVFFGYTVHLALDEIYSVDLVDARMKKSFGTALKIISLKSIKASFALTIATICIFFLTPRADVFLHTIYNVKTYQAIMLKLLPKDRWFQM